jgi:hypothetical protein
MAQSTLERLITRAIWTMCRALWGFSPRMIPHIVRRMGPVRALGWFAANFPRYLVTLRVLGPTRFHLACMAISLHNSCTYCAFGHAYALELVYLRDRDRLFPLDARTLAGWLDLEPRELERRLHGVLCEAGLHVEALWVDRTLALATGTQSPIDRPEARIAHLVRMLGTINAIASESQVEPDEAQNPVNKDRVIKAKHAELRASQVRRACGDAAPCHSAADPTEAEAEPVPLLEQLRRPLRGVGDALPAHHPRAAARPGPLVAHRDRPASGR